MSPKGTRLVAIVLEFPLAVSERTALDVAKRVAAGVKDDLKADGAEFFGADCPKVRKVEVVR